MGSSTGKNNTFFTEIVNYHPIIFDMTLSEAAIIAGKQVFPATNRQWIFPNNFYKNIKKFIRIITALFCQFEVFFKLIGESETNHLLHFQFFPQFFNRVIPFTWNFPASYVSGFLHGC